MFYKIVKYLFIACITAWLIFGIGLWRGWIGLMHTNTFLLLGILNIGLYVFHSTRATKAGNALVFKIVHWMAIPSTLITCIVFKGYLRTDEYWKPVNLVMLTLLYFPLLLILAQTTVMNILKYLLSFYFLALFILSLLHMAGKFENGRLLIILLVAGLISGILMIIFSKQKQTANI